MARKNRSPEENERRVKIRELLQASNVSSMHDVQHIYTQDAAIFANRNPSVLKNTYNYNYGNASWNFTYSSGRGGMFSLAGKMYTFWYR